MKPIAFYPELARLLGSIEAAIYFQQLFYWSDKGSRSDGFIYKTKEEIEEETTLSRFQQDRCRKMLEEAGWLETKLIKANGHPTIHYKCLQKIEVSISKKLANGNVRNSLINKRETDECITENTQRIQTGEAKASQELVVVAENETPLKEKKTTTKEVLQVLSLFEKKLKVDITGWGIDKTQRQSITNLLTRSKGKLDLIESALDFVVDYRDEIDYFPQVLSPYHLDKKWNQLKVIKAKHS